MAWTAPRDWTTAEFVTEAFLDAQIKDNMNALHNMTIVRRTTNIAGTSAYVAISWETEDLDELACWVIGTPTRFTAPYAGRFEINVTLAMTAATGTVESRIRVQRFTSASALVETWGENGSTVANQNLSVYGIGRLDSGDYLEVAQYGGASGTAPQLTARAVLVGRG